MTYINDYIWEQTDETEQAHTHSLWSSGVSIDNVDAIKMLSAKVIKKP